MTKYGKSVCKEIMGDKQSPNLPDLNNFIIQVNNMKIQNKRSNRDKFNEGNELIVNIKEQLIKERDVLKKKIEERKISTHEDYGYSIIYILLGNQKVHSRINSSDRNINKLLHSGNREYKQFGLIEGKSFEQRKRQQPSNRLDIWTNEADIEESKRLFNTVSTQVFLKQQMQDNVMKTYIIESKAFKRKE